MKSLKEMNRHEREAYELTKETYCDIVGGAENSIEDKAEGWEGWQKLLNCPENIRNLVYGEVIERIESRGNMAKHIKFAGADFIKSVIDYRMQKDGYC